MQWFPFNRLVKELHLLAIVLCNCTGQEPQSQTDYIPCQSVGIELLMTGRHLQDRFPFLYRYLGGAFILLECGECTLLIVQQAVMPVHVFWYAQCIIRGLYSPLVVGLCYKLSSCRQVHPT
jgi:hypothetical protein